MAIKFFSAVADAEYARAAFAAAGLDFDALRASKSIDALKSLKTAAEVEQILTTAKAENDTLTAQVAALNGDVNKFKPDAEAFTAVRTHLTASGVKFAKPEEVPAALEARIKARARELVAATGGVLLDENPDTDATSRAGAGEMTRADFNKLPADKQAAFCAQVRANKAKLID